MHCTLANIFQTNFQVPSSVKVEQYSTVRPGTTCEHENVTHIFGPKYISVSVVDSRFEKRGICKIFHINPTTLL